MAESLMIWTTEPLMSGGGIFLEAFGVTGSAEALRTSLPALMLLAVPCCGWPLDPTPRVFKHAPSMHLPPESLWGHEAGRQATLDFGSFRLLIARVHLSSPHNRRQTADQHAAQPACPSCSTLAVYCCSTIESGTHDPKESKGNTFTTQSGESQIVNFPTALKKPPICLQLVTRT